MARVNVLISALNQSATGADIQVNGMVQSDSGFITLIAADDIHTASEVLSNGAGDISLIARNNQPMRRLVELMALVWGVP